MKIPIMALWVQKEVGRAQLEDPDYPTALELAIEFTQQGGKLWDCVAQLEAAGVDRYTAIAATKNSARRK